MRVRIRFAKTEAMRYTGNLDVYRTLYRTLMRAGLPLAHKQGYARRPKLNLALPLPLGFTSDCEMADFWLEGHIPVDEIRQSIQSASPPGLGLISLEEITEGLPKLTKQVVSAEFVCTLIDFVPELSARIEKLLSQSTLPRERRGKSYDLRPLLLNLEILPENGYGYQRLGMTLLAQEGATGRPDEVVSALGILPPGVRFHRNSLNLRQKRSA